MKILNNILHSKARASHFKVKNLNVYFSNSIDKGFKFINLENIDFLEIYINHNNGVYELLGLLSKDNEEVEILLSRFENKIDAEKAFDKIKNELYGTGKSILTIFNTLLLCIIYIILISFLLSGNKNNGIQNNQSVPNVQSNGNLSEIQKQMLNNALQQIPQNSTSGMPNKVINPQEINNLINKAIIDAQNQNNNNNQVNIVNGQNVESNQVQQDDILNSFK